MKAFLNGRIIPLEELAATGFGDRGFTCGDGLLEVIRVRRGRLELLGEHARRVCKAAGELDLAAPASPDELSDLVRETVAANGGGDGLYHLYFTRGAMAAAIDPDAASETTVVIAPVEGERYGPDELAAGIRLATAPFPRNEQSPLSRWKTLHRLEALVARRAARQAGAHEALLLNTQGRVACAATANLFVVLAEEVVTPPVTEGALPGILRAALLVAARSLGRPVREAAITPVDLQSARDLFLTSSALGILSVAALDGRPLPPPVSKSWHKAFIPRLRLRVHELCERELLPA